MRFARSVSVAAVRAAVRDLDRPDPALHADAEEGVRETAAAFAKNGEPGLTYLESYVTAAFADAEASLYGEEVEGGVRVVVEAEDAAVSVGVLRDVRELQIARMFLDIGAASALVHAA
ncbi:hypothetical protein [Aureimonas sp. AU40]|uniref:hypothetical protein n=1 Tax=Aureimonas sp. AU40 TaxID=1637747 RepID=UPI000781CF96|nr:hypothetical protein [Aureimonas sp. AU40]